MKKRIFSFIIAIILSIQSPVMAVYAVDAVSFNMNNDVSKCDITESDISENGIFKNDNVAESDMGLSDLNFIEEESLLYNEECVSGNQLISTEENQVEINDVNFPDEAFRTYLKNMYDPYETGYMDGNEVTTIVVGYDGITSLKGIEFFPNLIILNCAMNNLQELDLSKNTNLQELDCRENKLKKLDVSKLTNLKILDCSGNELEELNINNNISLQDLNCSNNKLKELNTDLNINLYRFLCSGNQLSQLNVTNNINLQLLAFDSNQILETNLSKNTKLVSLNCNENQLKELDVSNNVNLNWLQCEKNQLESLDIRHNVALEKLECMYNALKNLNVGNNSVLSSISCGYNQLTELKLDGATGLQSLYCYDNSLKKLDVSKNINLQTLECSDNQLEEINLSNNSLVTYINCYNNQLKELDLNKCINLGQIFCSNNQLSNLNLSECINLIHLSCENNQLEELDLSGNLKLSYLQCDSNDALQWINLRGNSNVFESSNIRIPRNDDLIVYCDKDSWISSWCNENDIVQMYVNPGEEGEILPSRVELNISELCMLSGKEVLLQATVYPKKATDKTITWYSSDSNIVTVDNNGKITAIHPGEATITASTINQKTQVCNVKVMDMLPIDETCFPNSNFRNYVSYNFDTDKDGNLTDEECKNVKEIIISGDNGIYSLKGIEHFENLKVLKFSLPFGLMELDVSQNTKLEELYVTYNFLTELNLKNNTQLKVLECYNNQLTQLDLSNNIHLEKLSCGGNNLKELDISKNVKLKDINCAMSQLTKLDVSNNVELESLDCHENSLTELDVSHLKKLQTLAIMNNQIEEINLSNNPDLFNFYCDNNKLKKLDFSNNPLLFSLICTENPLTELYLPNNDNLFIFYCGKTNLKQLDLSNCPNINEFMCLENNNPIDIFMWHKDKYDCLVLFAIDKQVSVYSYKGTFMERVCNEQGIPFYSDSDNKKISVEKLQIYPSEVNLTVGESKQLQLVINPVNAADKSVSWKSSNEEVIKVDDKGNIRAVSAGIATITATSANQKKAECTVKVENNLNENELILPQNVTAVTNIHNTLEDITLANGWEWVNPEISLKLFSGEQEKLFKARYKKEGYREVIKQIPVKIITISKVNVITSDVIGKGIETPTYVEVVTNGLTVPESMLSIEWSSSDANIVAFAGEGQNISVVGKKAGNVQLSAKVILTDGNKETQFISANKKVVVTEEAPASIMFEMPENFVQNKNVYSYKYTNANEEAAIALQVTGTEKITLKSSDTKVVSVSKTVKGTDGKWSCILTIKKPGYIRLTAVAGDALATSKSIELYIKDAAPNINTGTIELNNKNTTGAFISICPNDGYVIEKASFDPTVEGYEKFHIFREENTDHYRVILSGNVEKGTYKQKLKVLVNGKEYEFPLTIKVTSKDPVVTVKQSGKVNVFYKNADGNGSLEVTSDESIQAITLEECDFSYSYESKQLVCTGNWNAPDKKGTLVIQIDGYKEPLKKNITISTEKKAPKIVLSAKSASLYPLAGIETAQVNITDTANGAIIQPEEVQVAFKPVKGKPVTAYKIDKKQNEVSFTRMESDFKAKVNAEILIDKKEYAAPIKLTYEIHVNDKLPTLVLDQKTITLNKAMAVHECRLVKVYPKDTQTEDITQIRITPGDAKSKEEKDASIVISEQDKNVLSVSLNDVADLKTGNYKFNIDGNYNGQKCQKTVLTVKIVDVAPNKTVKVTPKGSIDLLNRDTSWIYYTPKLSNITGEIVDVSLSGRSAHLFKAELENGKIKVSVTGNTKEEQDKVALVTKYKYGICLKLTLDNGFQTYTVTTDELKVTLTQSKPKVTVQPKQVIMFNTLNHRVKVTFKGVNKDKTTAPIKNIQLTNFKNVFSFDEKQNVIVITDKSSVVKGKTYTLKFNVYFDGCGDNEKPIQVNYKVKIQ